VAVRPVRRRPCGGILKISCHLTPIDLQRGGPAVAEQAQAGQAQAGQAGGAKTLFIV